MSLILTLVLATATATALRGEVISNTQLRRTKLGNVVGAQDGNIVNKKWRGEYALVGMAYGECRFTACQNQSRGACGFGTGRFLVWTSPTLGDNSWSEPVEILPGSDRPTDAIYFRPHVAWSLATKKWVLWVRWLPLEGPRLSDDPTLYLSAVSDSLTGPYVIAQRNVSMFYPNSADDNLFVDSDGTGYIVHTSRATGTKIVVEQLTADLTQTAGTRSDLIGPGGTEAPAMFKRYGVYYVTFANLCCYCTSGKETWVYRSTHALGPYVWDSTLGNAPGAQQNFVFPWVVDAASALGAGQVMWSGNRWGSDPVHTRPLFDYSLQYWSLLRFRSNGSTLPIVWEEQIHLTSSELRPPEMSPPEMAAGRQVEFRRVRPSWPPSRSEAA